MRCPFYTQISEFAVSLNTYIYKYRNFGVCEVAMSVCRSAIAEVQFKKTTSRCFFISFSFEDLGIYEVIIGGWKIRKIL